MNLIIWDRLFGTFVEEREDEEITRILGGGFGVGVVSSKTSGDANEDADVWSWVVLGAATSWGKSEGIPDYFYADTHCVRISALPAIFVVISDVTATSGKKPWSRRFKGLVYEEKATCNIKIR
ncbi:hypothetical protein GWK47_054124 [Chionoecetes opilio]|uniref:Uncharacterized protein n=1 Tax=Chionoecetes opilio TaxID=41210 RepID=A0A8J4Y5C1_CHIOP|nr:hypothetical protein GWK47_054124 [Chionoecetes opilio]